MDDLTQALTTRSPQDLIAELEEEGSKHWFAAIAVYFPDSSVFVKSDEADRLQLLNDSVRAGGIPIGLITVDRTEGEANIVSRVYPEYAQEEEARERLSKLTDYLVRRIVEMGKNKD